MSRSWIVHVSYSGEESFEVEADTLEEAYEEAESRASSMVPAGIPPESLDIEVDAEDEDKGDEDEGEDSDEGDEDEDDEEDDDDPFEDEID